MEITTWMMSLEDRINGERINGLFHLLIHSVYWGYNLLILTFDPNLLGHPSMRKCWDNFLGKVSTRHPVPPAEVWYLDPKNIPKTPNLRRYDWMSIGYGSVFTIVFLWQDVSEQCLNAIYTHESQVVVSFSQQFQKVLNVPWS